MDESWRAELAEFLAIPSVSADPAHAADVRRAAEWVRDFVQRAGGQAELVAQGDRELVIGELRASKGADAAPTVLVYGHYDVQPPAPLELWDSPPFELTTRDEWVYARGVADDKGQLWMLLKAAEELAREQALPVNVRVACDGEEEIGGHSIVDFLAADAGRADACVIYDSDMLRRGVPQFNVATRGLVYFHVRVTTGERDLHSGVYGGAAANAVHALIEMLGAVIPHDGVLPEALRAGIASVSRDELAGWGELQPGAELLAEQGARPSDDTAADQFYVRTFAEPALDVNGIEGGSPQLQKTVLPVEAAANLSIRLAPGQEVETIAAALEGLLRDAVPPGAELELRRLSAAPAGLVSPDAPAIQLGLDAFERALGVRPRLVRSGGTLPIVPALCDRGIPTILTGFALKESNIHSPNERLLIDSFKQGVAAARELYLGLSELP